MIDSLIDQIAETNHSTKSLLSTKSFDKDTVETFQRVQSLLEALMTSIPKLTSSKEYFENRYYEVFAQKQVISEKLEVQNRAMDSLYKQMGGHSIQETERKLNILEQKHNKLARENLELVKLLEQTSRSTVESNGVYHLKAQNEYVKAKYQELKSKFKQEISKLNQQVDYYKEVTLM